MEIDESSSFSIHVTREIGTSTRDGLWSPVSLSTRDELLIDVYVPMYLDLIYHIVL